MNAMQLAYDINLGVHAVSGLVALAVLAVPLISKKGGRVHRRAGWVFTAAMAGVALTGLGLALSWILVPLAVKPLEAGASAEQIASATRSYRAFGLFFATLAVMAGTAVWHGISATRIKRPRPGSWTRPFDHAAWIANVGLGLALLALGVQLEMGLFALFGGLALFNGVSDGRFVIRPPDQAGAWLIRHLQAMLGGATVAVTAFAVLVLRRYVSAEGSLSVIVWLIPAALGTVGTLVWTRIYKRRLGYGGADVRTRARAELRA